MHHKIFDNLFFDSLDVFFWCTLVPMMIGVAFFALYSIEESQMEKRIRRKILLIFFSPILPVYTHFVRSWTAYQLETQLNEAENDKNELKRLTRNSNQAHLIEVCTESSLQPLVQLFSIFSGLMEAYSSQENTKWDETIDALLAAHWSKVIQLYAESKMRLQIWSLVSSIVSIAWSFQANYARKKYGQMTLLSRVIYFLCVLLFVTSRIISIIMVIFFVGGKDSFCYIYVIIGCHMALTISLDLWLNAYKYRAKKPHWFWKIRDCLMKAFSSIYMYHPPSDKESEDLRMHVAMDLLISLEFTSFTGIILWANPNASFLLLIIWAAFIIAFALKGTFYFSQHPWAGVLIDDFTSWRSPLKEPTIGKVKGPRKSKWLAIWDRVSEGMLCHGTICNKGDYDPDLIEIEEAKGR